MFIDWLTYWKCSMGWHDKRANLYFPIRRYFCLWFFPESSIYCSYCITDTNSWLPQSYVFYWLKNCAKLYSSIDTEYVRKLSISKMDCILMDSDCQNWFEKGDKNRKQNNHNDTEDGIFDWDFSISSATSGRDGRHFFNILNTYRSVVC